MPVWSGLTSTIAGRCHLERTRGPLAVNGKRALFFVLLSVHRNTLLADCQIRQFPLEGNHRLHAILLGQTAVH